MTETNSESSNNRKDTPKLELLLAPYYGEFYEPVNWELGKKSKNYFAKISKGTKTIFNRIFINSSKLDDKIVFRQGNFPEGEIIEQKCVFIKGTKQEATFHGFFIIHHTSEGIMGEKISQKDALEYFDCCQLLPEIEPELKSQLRVKIGTVIRKLSSKYGEEIISEILMDIITEYFPTPDKKN